MARVVQGGLSRSFLQVIGVFATGLLCYKSAELIFTQVIRTLTKWLASRVLVWVSSGFSIQHTYFFNLIISCLSGWAKKYLTLQQYRFNGSRYKTFGFFSLWFLSELVFSAVAHFTLKQFLLVHMFNRCAAAAVVLCFILFVSRVSFINLTCPGGIFHLMTILCFKQFSLLV
jgi:hypothetical protein